jgi:hypothetical protein
VKATFAVLGLAATAVWLGGCKSDRLRPGPPTLTIELPPGATVYSPDTLGLVVRAHDDNGLDSVTVTILGRTEEVLGAFNEMDAVGVFIWPIPDGLPPGTLVEILARAKDLVGDRTTTTASVTVIARPAMHRGSSVDPPRGPE